jgi:hypothetical protein
MERTSLTFVAKSLEFKTVYNVNHPENTAYIKNNPTNHQIQILTMEHLGNTDLLKLPKTAILCSRVSAELNHRLPASVVLRCYESLNLNFHKMMRMNKKNETCDFNHGSLKNLIVIKVQTTFRQHSVQLKFRI